MAATASVHVRASGYHDFELEFEEVGCVHWLIHVLGLDDASGHWYLFWSGVGADISELAILGGIVAAYRKHLCHVGWCWRLGVHPVAETPYRACRRHHPTVPNRVSAQDIAEAHEQTSRTAS